MGKVMSTQHKKAQERTLTIALIDNGGASEFRQILQDEMDQPTAAGTMVLRQDVSLEDGRELVEAEEVDAIIDFDPDFDEQLRRRVPAQVSVYFKQTDKGRVEKGRILGLLNTYKDRLYERRLVTLGIDPKDLEPLEITQHNLASEKERLAGLIGGFLPYLFIIFSLTGCLHPATDLAAGEKERGTLETLLTCPATRLQILIGKFIVVVGNGFFSAGISMLGLYIGFRSVAEIPEQMQSGIASVLEMTTILTVFSLLLPLTIFFAAVALSLSIYAKSFKEAQSLLMPLIMVSIIPVYAGVIPGMELSTTTALIPILNVSMAIKAIIAGTATPALLAMVYASLIALAALSLLVCSKMFGRESAVFRSA
jgi:sodium transport system permease protein